jgi:transcriptional regulator with XRE-family HTH domain
MPARKKTPPITEIEALTNRLIGQRLQRVRAARRLTLTQLGAKIGVTYQSIQRYQKGGVITPGTLKALAGALGVSVSYFFDIAAEDERNSERPRREELEFMRAVQRIERSEPARFWAIFKMVKTIAKAVESR